MPITNVIEIFGDFDHDGKRDAKPFRNGDWIIVPPAPPDTDAEPTAILLLRTTGDRKSAIVEMRSGGPEKLLVREDMGWRPTTPRLQPQGFRGVRNWYDVTLTAASVEIGITAPLPLDGSGFSLNIDGQSVECRITPVLLASSLDPAEEVFVVRNPLNRKFVAELARIVAKAEGKPKLRTIDTAAGASDLWMQDSVEIGRFAYPVAGGKVKQGVAPILGLRAKHDMGLNCAPLDTAVRAFFDNAVFDNGDAVPIAAGEPLPGRRWIDWFGNLEVSPPVKNFPHGRILTGDQKGLRFHPDVLKFLELQKLQWPPLILDVGWLTIGHVDETINFVPASDRQGFRVLLPSPAAARRLLEDAARAGQGNAPVFAGKTEFNKNAETTVTRFLDEYAHSAENRSIDAALKETRQQIKEGLSVEDADIVEIPCLFKDGLAVIPNMVNCLVLGRDLVLPAPIGPIIAGEDVFQKALRTPLEPLGLRLHFVDIWEPYHVRSGEIHCGTNAIRRLKNPVWWKGM